ncbi:hypothetical protein [Streptomyces goshikiensis]|uniref:hypothetical protein n=1 Tax=Streptomyces goshikiensis TaxID=1942 RepID=UPI0036A8716C
MAATLTSPSPTTTPPASYVPWPASGYLRPEDTELAERVDALTQHTGQHRQSTHDQRSA